jgi:hypothetical protein
MATGGAKYFVSADGKKLGPFTGQQLRTKLFRKTITADDYVWRDGLGDSWVKISAILDELPSDAMPPPAPETEELRHIEITHPDGSASTPVEVPEKGVYEPPATPKQKNLLMKLGCSNPDAIRHIGRDQASFIIDRIKEDYSERYARHVADERRATIKALAIAVIIALGIGLVFAAVAWFQSPLTH